MTSPCDHGKLIYELSLQLTPYQLKVLYDLVEDDMHRVERMGYGGTTHHLALHGIEKQIATFRGQAPRTPTEPRS